MQNQSNIKTFVMIGYITCKIYAKSIDIKNKSLVIPRN